MTREEFEQNDRFEHAKFISDNRHLAKVNAEDKENIKVHVIDRVYDIYLYLDLYISYVAIKATDEKIEENQLEILVEARSAIVHLTERTKREISKEYDFSGFLGQIDALIKMSEAELHVKLLKSQIKTNENTINTNDNTRQSNVINRWLLGGTTLFAFFALLVSCLQCRIQSRSYQLELHKIHEDKSKKLLQQENKLLQVKLGKTAYLFDSIKNSLRDSSHK